MTSAEISDSLKRWLAPLLIGGALGVSVMRLDERFGIASHGEEVIDASRFGLIDDPSCTLDQAQALRGAFAAAAGRTLQLPGGTFCVKRSDGTLRLDAPATRVVGRGAVTVLKWAAPKGSKIAPLLDVKPTARRSSVLDVAFDHSAADGQYTDADYFGPNAWGGVMVAIEADDFTGARLWGRDGFDNCFGVSEIDERTKQARRGYPHRVRLESISTERCGVGVHGEGHGGGAGSHRRRHQ